MNREIMWSLQLGQEYFAYTLKNVLPFAFFNIAWPSKAGKELFLEQILLSN